MELFESKENEKRVLVIAYRLEKGVTYLVRYLSKTFKDMGYDVDCLIGIETPDMKTLDVNILNINQLTRIEKSKFQPTLFYTDQIDYMMTTNVDRFIDALGNLFSRKLYKLIIFGDYAMAFPLILADVDKSSVYLDFCNPIPSSTEKYRQLFMNLLKIGSFRIVSNVPGVFLNESKSNQDRLYPMYPIISSEEFISTKKTKDILLWESLDKPRINALSTIDFHNLCNRGYKIVGKFYGELNEKKVKDYDPIEIRSSYIKSLGLNEFLSDFRFGVFISEYETFAIRYFQMAQKMLCFIHKRCWWNELYKDIFPEFSGTEDLLRLIEKYKEPKLYSEQMIKQEKFVQEFCNYRKFREVWIKVLEDSKKMLSPRKETLDKIKKQGLRNLDWNVFAQQKLFPIVEEKNV